MQFITVQGQVEFTLAVRIIYHRAGIPIDRIDSVGIQVGQQEIVIAIIQILE